MLKCAFESIFQNTSPTSPLGLVSAIVVRTFSIAISPPPRWYETHLSPHDGFMNSDYRICINNEHIWSLKVAPPVNLFTSASPYHTVWLKVFNEIRAPSIKEKHFDGEFSSSRLRYLIESHAQKFSSANSSCLACEVDINHFADHLHCL